MASSTSPASVPHPDGQDARREQVTTWLLTLVGVSLVAAALVIAAVSAAATDGPQPGSPSVAPGRQTAAPATGGVPAPQGTSGPAPDGPHHVTLVQVLPPGARPDAVTTDQLRATVDGEVSAFWAEQTQGRVWFQVTSVHSWLTTPVACDKPLDLWSAVGRAVGFRPGPGEHLVVYIPSAVPGCASGVGTVGSGPGSGGDVLVRGRTPAIIGHELGHNLGLEHSERLQCDATSDPAVTTLPSDGGPGCRLQPYGDWYDVMGISWDQLGSLAVGQAQRLGVLPSDEVAVVHADATVNLAPRWRHDGTQALVVQVPGAATYTVEYRTAAGRDSWLADNWAGLTPGVLVRRSGPGPTGTQVLLDASPSPRSQWEHDTDSALHVGHHLLLDGGRIELTVVSADGARAQVSVTLH